MRSCIFRGGAVAVLCLSGLLRSSAAQFTTDFGAGLPPGSSLVGNAVIGTDGGLGNSPVLKLTAAAGGQQGSFIIEDIAAGNPVTAFKVLFKVAIGGGTTRPADGMAFAFGTDVGGSFGEEGVGTGISVTFDTWDNNGDDTAPAIDVRTGGAIIAVQSMSTGGAGNPFREGGRAPAGPVLQDSLGADVNLQTLGPGPDVPKDSSYVDVVIELFPDNTFSVSWSNIVVFDHLAIPYTPIAGGRFAFGARTGGATEDHWIDDLAIFANWTPGPATITTPPADTTVNETFPGTFSVGVDGTPPFTAQWFSNNVAIAGATQLTYTTPPSKIGMNGTVYKVQVSNAESVTPVEASAVLNVNPALVLVSASSSNRADKVFVHFSKGVTRVGTYSLSPVVAVNAVAAGATPEEVVLSVDPLTFETTYTLTVAGETGTDGASLLPDPSTITFHFGFGSFCHDFNDNVLPAGTALAGVATMGGPAGNDGSIHLTDAGQAGACGAYFIPDQISGSPLDRLQARWRSLVGHGNNGGADGYSFNWAPDVAGPGNCGGSEEGGGSGLSVTVDTFDNGGGEVGTEIKWRGTRVAFQQLPKDDPGDGSVFLRKGTFVDASVEVLPTGIATFNYDGVVISATLPGFVPIAGGNFQFVGRTGGADDDQWIDDVRINCFTLAPPVFTESPTDTTIVEGDAATFHVSVDGAPPLTLQWFTNGVAVPGAITATYTTPVATPALDGLQITVKASNDFGTTTTPPATIHVQLAPRLVKVFTTCDDSLVHVIWSKPVLLNGSYAIDLVPISAKAFGSNNAEVLLTTDPLPSAITATLTVQDEHDAGGNIVVPNPVTGVFRYGFGAFCTDFTTLPDGAVLGGDATVGGADGTDGILHLTEAHTNGACGSIFIPDQLGGAPLDRLQVRWKSRVGGGDAGADGYSFNWAKDLPSTGCAGGGEEGVGTGLTVDVDTFDNGAPLDVGGTGIQIKWKGTVVAFAPIPKDPDASSPTYIRKDTFVDAAVDVLPNGLAQFTYDGVIITAKLPGFTSMAGANFMFAARTGGANDNHWIDDLCINAGLVLPDSIGPVIVVPSTIVVNCTAAQSPVTFDVSAYDFCEGPIPVTTVPASGSLFPVGATTVTATAQDVAGNKTTRTFTVLVQDKPAVLSIVRDGNNVVVTYPQTCVGFVLEQTSALGGAWAATGVAPVASGGNLTVTVSIGPDNKFFRLHEQ